MKSCEDFQAQMLDHLYGLLEPYESRPLVEHAEQCPACAPAFARARQQQKLLGAAARLEFPGVRFQAPVVTPAPDPGPVSPPVPAHGSWVRWAVAAVILLAVGGLGVPGAIYWRQNDLVASEQDRYQKLKKEEEQVAREYRNSLDQAGQELLRIQQEIERLPQERQDRLQSVQKTIQNKQLKMVITGPEKLEPGATNTYQIRVHNRSNQAVPARISAKVIDQDKNVVYEQKDVASKGELRVALPPDLPLKPNAELSLVVSARGDDGRQGELNEKLALDTPLYFTHLTTDKPMYQPGEVVRFRSLTLERFSLRPAQEDLHLVYTLTKPTGEKVQVLNGLSRVTDEHSQDGRPILGPDRLPVRGLGAGEYHLDADAPGGQYTLAVGEADNRFQPQERKFIVNQYEVPRLNKELEFTAKSYGPGDTVVAACKVARAESEVPVADQEVKAIIRIDGKTYDVNGKEGNGQVLFRTDATGAVNVKFRLPSQIDRGEGSLSVQFTDGASVETLVRNIPIVVHKLQVEFFPEGGDLVAGVPNRVYFQARTMLDKPAEVKGRVIDDQGQEVATAQTFNVPNEPGANQGLGVFSFQPQAGRKYGLKIDSPSAIEGRYPLPEVKVDGVVLTVPEGVTRENAPIRVVLRSARADRNLVIGAYCRGRLMGYERVEVRKDEAREVVLQPEGPAGGVYRVTVFEEKPGTGDRQNLVPKAERLIYRRPAERLNLTVQPDKKRYVPGDPVNLVCLARNEKGEAAPAILLVAVTDKSVLKLADEKTFRTMPTHFLLTTEVRHPEDLEHADFFLTDKSQAAVAVDLLLGTQGWRRFAEQNPNDFRQKHPQEAERLLVSIGQLAPTLTPKTTDFDQQAFRKVDDEYRAHLVAAQARLAEAAGKQRAAAQDERLLAAREHLKEEANNTQENYSAAVLKLNAYRETAGKLASRILPALAVLLLVGGVGSLLVGLKRAGQPQALPYFMGAVCSILLCGFLATVLVNSQDNFHVAQLDDKLPGGADSAWNAADPTSGPAGRAAPEVAAAPQAKGLENLGLNGLLLGDANRADAFMLKADRPNVQAMPPQAFDDLDRAKAEAKGLRGGGDKEALPLPPKPAPRLAAMGREVGKLPALLPNKQADGRAAGLAKKAAAEEGRRQGLELPRDEKAALAPRLPPVAGPAPAAAGQLFPPGAAAPMMPEQMQRGLRDRERGEAFEAQFAAEPPPPPASIVVREYAHQHGHGEGNVRADFTQTLCWQPVLVLPDGKAELAFDLSDAVTTFQVMAVGHTLDGRLGAVTTELKSQKPFTLEPKLPIEVTASDQIEVPLAIANNTDDRRSVSVRVQPTNLTLVEGQANRPLTLDANQRTRLLYRFRPSVVEGEARLNAFGGESDGFGDHVERNFKVVPEGFPIVGSKSDLLEGVARLDKELVLPETWVKGTLKFQVAVYPSTLADLQKGLEALLQEPGGCFEQTSTSNYPNLLILDYLKETDQARPEVARRARDLLARGYQKLTAFECLNPSKNQREGYEWFGGTAPAHEALTAYGLLEFRDMARVYDVDQAMLDRTRNYLMSRKDGKGGFQRNPLALDSFGRAPDNVTNAYIVWALTESGKDDDVTKELNAQAEQAKTSKDPYFLALVANSLLNRGRTEEGIALLQELAKAQKPDGHLDAAVTSITGSGGRDLQIETTALSLYAWLKAQQHHLFTPNVEAAVKWIGQQRGGYGGFGSTQSTILALKALIAYAKSHKGPREAGDLILYVKDREVARRHFEAGVAEALVLTLPEAEKVLKPGHNDVRVEITGKSLFPYTAAWSYRTLKPPSADNCPVGLGTRLDRQRAAEGESVRLTVAVENKSSKGQGMTVAIVGLPAGLTLPEDMKQLQDLARLRNDGKEPGLISAFETRGRELVLYWRDMAPDKKVEVNLDLICRVPGEYSGPASRAYLYYNADAKCWVDPLKMAITSRAAK